MIICPPRPRSWLLSLCFLALASCGGRSVHEVAPTSPFDDQLSCDELRGERQVNALHIADLDHERHDDQVHNLGMLLVAPEFVDLSDSEVREIKAYQARNQTLDHLIAARCPPSKGGAPT